MATAKKPVTKKTPAKKPTSKPAVKKASAQPSPAKTVVRKKAPTKKAASSKAAAVAPVRSFRLSRNDVPFGSFKVTRQTIYWIILVSFIIFVQLWIIQLQIDVATLIERQQTEFLENL